MRANDFKCVMQKGCNMKNLKSSFQKIILLLLVLVIVPNVTHAASLIDKEEQAKMFSLAEHFIFNTFSEEATGEVEKDIIAENCDDFLKYCTLRLKHNKFSQIPVDSRKMDLKIKDVKNNGPFIDVKFRAIEHIQYSGIDTVSMLGYDYYIRFVKQEGEYKIVKASDGGVFEREIRAYVEADYPDLVHQFEEKSNLDASSTTLRSADSPGLDLDQVNYSYNDMIEASFNDMLLMKEKTTSVLLNQDSSKNIGENLFAMKGSLNRTAMRNYMDRWAFDRNPSYLDASSYGGDCTNYASQIMRAGGASFDRSGPMPQKWFYYNSTPGSGRSYSWAGTNNLHEYLKSNEKNGLKGSRYWIDLYGQRLKTGDLVFLYRKTSSGNDSKPYHTLITSKPASDVLVSAHTGDCLDKPLSRWSSANIRKLAMYVSGQ